jgi:pSer/pThr/pTyr-binding forkhead associated (FHA) protein
LVEGGAARLFPFSATASGLAPDLIDAMQAGVKTRPDGHRVAPNLYILTVHPSREEALQSNPALLKELAQTIQRAGKVADLVFLSPPEFRVVPDEDVPPQQIHVIAKISLENLGQTTDMEVEAAESGPALPDNAFLIVDGTEVFALTQSVVNIGRRSDNQLVIDDVRVSRVHAQLRAIKGRYVIFDLDSTGGTFVNDQRIVQSILFPGDVISLAGVPIVFGQDTSGYGQTQKFDFPEDAA